MSEKFFLLLLSLICLFSFFGFGIQIPPAHASEGSVYDFSWLDPDKEVYVLQNRKFRKKGNFHLNAGYGVTTSGAFVGARSVQGRAGYFFKEEWGIEGIYAKNNGSENEAAQSVRNVGGAGSTPFRRIVDHYYGAFVLWAPFYGKLNTFNKILYFDWLIGLGLGKMEEANNKDSVRKGYTVPDVKESHNTYMWETGFKFYYNEYFHIRLDLTGQHYKATRARYINTSDSTGWYSNYDVTMSLGLNF